MGIEYEMAPLGSEIADAYARLFPEDTDKTPDALDWRFRDNPHGSGIFVIARNEGRVGGMIGLIASNLLVEGRPVRGFQAVDGIVDPALRGRSVFASMGRMLEDWVAGQDAVLWGFPNAAAARIWFGRLDWVRTGSAPFLIRPLRSGYVLRRLSPWLERFDLRLFASPRNLKRKAHAAIDDRYERLWASVRDGLGVAVDRSGDWLRWRMAKPRAGYTWAFDDSGSAFVATRTADKHGGKIAYVMEAMAAPQRGDALARLLRREVALQGEAGAEVALAWCRPQSPQYASYRKAGFLPFPERLRPAEVNHGYWLPPAGPAAGAGAGKSWHLSYLDSDTV